MLLSIGSRLRFDLDVFRSAQALICYVAEMRQAVSGRRAIARMDDRMLSDIGLSHGDAQAEISRRPWDVSAKPSSAKLGLDRANSKARR